MKIKLSKSQWSEIGKKAGWISVTKQELNKKAYTDPLTQPITPVNEIIGTKIHGTADEIDKIMHEKGYFLFREHYPWGRTLSYQNKNGDKVYLEKGTWLDENQLKQVIRDTWTPSSQKDQDYYVTNLR